MKAEIEDMPEHLRTPKKPGPWRFVAIMGIGSAVFCATMMMFAKPIAVDIDQIKKGVHVSGTPWFNQEQAQPAKNPEPYRTAPSVPSPAPIRATAQRELSQSEIEWFEQASKEAQARRQEQRQTSFNDQNYERRGAVNSLPPPTTLNDSARKSETTSARKEIVVVGKEDRPENWACSYFGKEGSIQRRECKMRYQLDNRN